MQNGNEEPLSTSTATVLIADEEPLVRKMLADLLIESGYRVIAASDGADVLEKFNQYQENISLCILDTMLSKFNATRVFHLVREKNQDLPVIFISEYSSDENKVVNNNIGLLNKPLNTNILLKMINHLLYNTKYYS